jgi:hypothetical protein
MTRSANSRNASEHLTAAAPDEASAAMSDGPDGLWLDLVVGAESL